MKYAIIADIHANLNALQAVLDDIKAQQCTHTACLGDVVGYFFHPKECLDIIRNLGIPCVKGNHDEYCSSDSSLDGFNPQLAEHIQWTRAQLTENDRKWLSDLPYVLVLSGFTIVHATLEEPQRWGYVFDGLAAAAHFAHQTTPVCFFGHTHVPVAFVRDTMVRGGTFSTFKVEHGKRYFVNVGAVGQPRDNNPKACYATYDLDSGVIECRRVDYEKPDFGQGGVKGPFPSSGGKPPPLTGANLMEG